MKHSKSIFEGGGAQEYIKDRLRKWLGIERVLLKTRMVCPSLRPPDMEGHVGNIPEPMGFFKGNPSKLMSELVAL
jgi:hypothetical protein